MGDIVEIGIRIAIFIGIALYMWSVSSSLEQIAKDLKRLADQHAPKERVGDPDELMS